MVGSRVLRERERKREGVGIDGGLYTGGSSRFLIFFVYFMEFLFCVFTLNKGKMVIFIKIKFFD